MIGVRTVLVVAIFVAASPVLAQEEVLFEEASSGILELAGQKRLKIEGFAGTVSVRAGKKGELRYSAATRTSRRVEHPVALWLRGATIIFRPVEGQEADKLILEIALSEGVMVEVKKRGGRVQISGLLSDVSVDADDSEIDVVAVDGPVDVRAEGGALRIENVGAEVSVDATSVSPVQLINLDRGANLTFRECDGSVGPIGGEVELDLTKSKIKIAGARARLSGSASDSRLLLRTLRHPVSLRLDGTPVDLTRCAGGEIETDSDVTFSGLTGDLQVTGFGGSVSGEGVGGSVTIENSNAAISLTNVKGPVAISGQGLEVTLEELANKLTAKLSGSTINAKGIKGGLDVTNDFGDVSFEDVEGASTVYNDNGNVYLTRLIGSLELGAEGPEVRVGWSTIGVERDSSITNDGGDVYVDFPLTGGARVEATADSAETSLPDIRVEGKTVHGLVGGADKPTVTIRSAGRLVLTQGGAGQ